MEQTYRFEVKTSHALVCHLSKRSTNLSLVDFANDDWASDLNDRNSTSDYCVYFSNKLVS